MFNQVELTVVLPGLAAILNQQINAKSLPTNLAKITSHADFNADRTNLERLLFSYFSDLDETNRDLALASLINDNKQSIIVSPCYLHPDRDQLLLFSDELEITEGESKTLMHEVQALLADIGGVLTFYTAEIWLLELENLPDLSLSALAEVSGNSVDNFLPTGDDRKQWLNLWNEIQMQLFNAAINQQRESQRKLPINSVWFWGAGEFKVKQLQWKSVQGSQPLLALLSENADIKLIDNNACSIESLCSGQHLYVLDKIDIEADWQQQMAILDQDFLHPLWRACQRGRVSTVNLIIPQYGHYQLSSLDCWKFWKS